MTCGITSSLSFPLHKNSALIIEGFKSISYLAVVMCPVHNFSWKEKATYTYETKQPWRAIL